MSSWMWPSSVRRSISSRSKSAAPWKIGSSPLFPVITGKSVTWTRSTRPAPISARFIDRLPCERNGTSDPSLSRATTATASPLTPLASGQPGHAPSLGDPSAADGVRAHDVGIRPAEGAFQCGRHHRGRQAPPPADPRVTHLGLLGARGQHPRERPVRVGPEDHPLLLAIEGEAVLEELGAL